MIYHIRLVSTDWSLGKREYSQHSLQSQDSTTHSDTRTYSKANKHKLILPKETRCRAQTSISQPQLEYHLAALYHAGTHRSSKVPHTHTSRSITSEYNRLTKKMTLCSFSLLLLKTFSIPHKTVKVSSGRNNKILKNPFYFIFSKLGSHTNPKSTKRWLQ